MTRMRLLVASGGCALSLAAAVPAGGAAAPAAGCPAQLPPVAAGAHYGAMSVLVPGRPRRVLLCRYGGLNDQPPGALAGQGRLVRDRAVRRLRAAFDRLPVPAAGVTNCPADDGAAVVAVFRYRHGSPLTVWTGLNGCRTATNGNALRSASRAQALIDRLTSLTS